MKSILGYILFGTKSILDQPSDKRSRERSFSQITMQAARSGHDQAACTNKGHASCKRQATFTEYSQAALVDDCRAALVDDCQAALVDDCQAALVDDSQAARLGDSQAARLGDSQAARLGDSQAARLGDSQASRGFAKVGQVAPERLYAESNDGLGNFEGLIRNEIALSFINNGKLPPMNYDQSWDLQDAILKENPCDASSNPHLSPDLLKHYSQRKAGLPLCKPLPTDSKLAAECEDTKSLVEKLANQVMAAQKVKEQHARAEAEKHARIAAEEERVRIAAEEERARIAAEEERALAAAKEKARLKRQEKRQRESQKKQELKHAEMLKQAEAQREAEMLRQYEVQREAEMLRQAEVHREAEMLRQAEAQKKAEIQRKAEMQREAEALCKVQKQSEVQRQAKLKEQAEVQKNMEEDMMEGIQKMKEICELEKEAEMLLTFSSEKVWGGCGAIGEGLKLCSPNSAKVQPKGGRFNQEAMRAHAAREEEEIQAFLKEEESLLKEEEAKEKARHLDKLKEEERLLSEKLEEELKQKQMEFERKLMEKKQQYEREWMEEQKKRDLKSKLKREEAKKEIESREASARITSLACELVYLCGEDLSKIREGKHANDVKEVFSVLTQIISTRTLDDFRSQLLERQGYGERADCPVCFEEFNGLEKYPMYSDCSKTGRHKCVMCSLCLKMVTSDCLCGRMFDASTWSANNEWRGAYFSLALKP
jgi:hypothetical protein